MPLFNVDVDFLFQTTVQVEAVDATEASTMIMNANHDQIAHINGKSYADVTESIRTVTKVTEVV